jgi:protein-arginine kinase activator protein McsA
VRELEQAVAAEQYERAAQLRDRIQELRPAAPGAEGVR